MGGATTERRMGEVTQSKTAQSGVTDERVPAAHLFCVFDLHGIVLKYAGGLIDAMYWWLWGKHCFCVCVLVKAILHDAVVAGSRLRLVWGSINFSIYSSQVRRPVGRGECISVVQASECRKGYEGTWRRTNVRWWLFLCVPGMHLLFCLPAR